MEFITLLSLIIINGLFAMAEIAIVSSRKSKLQHLADGGDAKAAKALELAKNPNRFLSTVQIGITFVGIFAGAFGAETIAKPLSESIQNLPMYIPYSEQIAVFLIVLVTTYLSLVIGELVPKRIALTNPEKIASLVSTPIQAISVINKPLVDILSTSTEWMLRLFGVKAPAELPVSEDEVKMLIREGARIGIFNLAERDIVERTFLLADQRVHSLMTPQNEIVWLDADSSMEQLRQQLAKSSFSYLPVSHKTLDTAIGVVRTKELLKHFLETNAFDIQKLMHKPTFLPETMNALRVLEIFKKSGIHVALVVDEYGHISGLISITDILEAIVGDIPTLDEKDDQTIIKREDGSYLIDGLATVEECKEALGIRHMPDEKSGAFHTIGGFVIHKLGYIPKSGDSFNIDELHVEVVDMDGNRVDKVLMKRT